MATYDNSYATKLNITPANPLLRGLTTNYSNDGQENRGGIGLGDLFELDYDRNKIEQIFNQGTDAQYALMQKEAQVAENNYANQQFQNQFNTMETLRAQRNEQIASGMARGLNAASDQATALGIQQEAMNGALELAQNRQMQADQIAAEYAQNVVKALQEANSVKEAIANVSAQLYEADMLGYTGELSALGQLDANASDRYGYDLGLEGTKYNADKNLEGTIYNADKNLEGTIYNADRNLEGTRYSADLRLEGDKYAADKGYQGALAQAAATRYAAEQQAAATRAASALSAASGGSVSTKQAESELEYVYRTLTEANPDLVGNDLVSAITRTLRAEDPDSYASLDINDLWASVDRYVVAKSNGTKKDQTWEDWNNAQQEAQKNAVWNTINNIITSPISDILNGNFSSGGGGGAGGGHGGGR